MTQSNQPVGAYTFQRPDGTEVRLADFPARLLMLIFLRHLA